MKAILTKLAKHADRSFAPGLPGLRRVQRLMN